MRVDHPFTWRPREHPGGGALAAEAKRLELRHRKYWCSKGLMV